MGRRDGSIFPFHLFAYQCYALLRFHLGQVVPKQGIPADKRALAVEVQLPPEGRDRSNSAAADAIASAASFKGSALWALTLTNLIMTPAAARLLIRLTTCVKSCRSA